MSRTDAPATQVARAGLPGAELIARIRRLLITSLAAGVAYLILPRGSRAFCPGGVDGSGGFLDANGDPTGVAPSCIQLTLAPSPLVIIAIAVIVIACLTRLLRRAGTVGEALRILDRAALAIGILVAVSIAVAMVWFWMIPITDWTPAGATSLFFPFPFAAVDVTVTPMVRP